MTSLRLQFRDQRELHQWIFNECVYRGSGTAHDQLDTKLRFR
jgi:hypothetical protein